MASNIKTLKEDNGDIVYPQTLTGAVYTSNNTALDTELAKYVTAEDIATTATSFGTITTGMISDGAITTAKIDDGAATTAKIANNAVTANKIDFTTFPHIIACGRVNIGTISAYSGKSVTVNIPTQSNTNYYVTVSYSDGGAEFASCGLTVNSRTTNNFVIHCWNTTASTSGNLNAFYIVTRND